ncbi:Serine/threonine-protein kinase PrkC (Ser/Thr-protein kinase PrkC) [Durusdinium trenchii]|uniref:non-specific serine/threonine protein kinase n=1 Tax=Durusdinium trenchii TaxID=1381693 RepID=A0ABP0JNB3_9DINO
MKRFWDNRQRPGRSPDRNRFLPPPRCHWYRAGCRTLNALDPPSVQLANALTELRLVNARGLRRCRPLVARFARDVPAFDSVWLDALVRKQLLTPFQAQVLGRRDYTGLRVGPCVLRQPLQQDPVLTLFEARRLDERTPALVTRVDVGTHSVVEVAERFRERWGSVLGREVSGVVIPEPLEESEERLALLSRHVAGQHLEALLVRRGRFPVSAARSVALQLATALAELERYGLVHGDVRLKQIWLQPSGRVAVFHPGVLSAIEPRFHVYSRWPIDYYDGVAPERIASQGPATSTSDIYAWGCLVWQLLAGRPPHPQADRLMKLASHESRDIVDVREWAPDVPEDLALVIHAATRRSPEDRPESFAEIVTKLDPLSRRQSGRMRRFVRSFETAAPRPLRDDPAPRRFVVGKKTVAASALIAAGVLLASEKLPLPSFTSPPDSLSQSDTLETVPEADGTDPTPAVASRLPDNDEWPSMTPTGVVTLQPGATYVAFLTWNLLDEADPTSGRLLVRETAFLGDAAGVRVEGPFSAAGFEHVLKVGGGPLLVFESGARPGLKAPLVLNACSLRNSDGIIRFESEEGWESSGRLSIQGVESVVASTRPVSLVQFVGEESPRNWERHVEIAAEGLILTGPVEPVAWKARQQNAKLATLSTDRMKVDGLLTGSVEFAGPSLSRIHDSRVIRAEVPLRRSASPPGVDPARLVPRRSATYNEGPAVHASFEQPEERTPR